MKVLVVIDMQVDFITGSLANEEGQKIVQNVKNKIDEYIENHNTVVFTQDTHPANYLQTQEGRNLPVEHCIKGNEGWNIVPQLRYPQCKSFEKPTFGSIEMAQYTASLSNIEEIEIVGVCTDICVISNAMILKAAMPEIPIRVDANCCAGTTIENHDNALKAMAMCQIDIKH